MSAVADSTGAQVAGRSQTGQSQQTGSRSGLKRDVGRISLLFTSVGSVIGSGWLLGALNATTVAGPAAIISWVVGAMAIMLLALIHAELGGMHHVNGGIARFPHYAFGSLVGFGMGWVYWLGSVTLAPVETEAALQYGDKWVNEAVGFHLVHTLGRAGGADRTRLRGRRGADAALHADQPVGRAAAERQQHGRRLVEDRDPGPDRSWSWS